MSMDGERLPFPGLRAFTREETDLFFGREGSVDQMIDRLAATRFLAVLGASGSGKSSLVKTGLLDGLELGLLAAAGSYWLIADFKPGDKPIANMAHGLLVAASGDPDHVPDEDDVRWLRALLVRSPRSIVDWCATNLPQGANLLLLADQFEELFRYGEYSEREEAEAFAALLLESARAPLAEARIYVTITMRSEYLGAAALIDGLAEAINRGLYLTPRMGRDEVREAIVGPAAVCEFEIEPLLVNRLLNDLTTFAPWEEEGDTGHQLERLVRRADQLPLMQHVLNRMWSLAAERDDPDKTVLTLKDYEAVGGLRGALAAHGQEILEELLPEHRAVAPAVFRALTSGSSLAEAVRRPTEFGELVEIAGDQIAVREIVDAFRAPGRNFLAPPRSVALRAETLIDISHESLIRQWEQFSHWLHDEANAADSWRRLVDQAERRQRGEADLLSGPALANLASWWDTEQPNWAWAKRYGGDYELAKSFLEESRRAEEAAKEAEAEARRRRTRTRVGLAAAVMIAITVTAGGFAIYQNRIAAEMAEQREIAVEAQERAEAAAIEAYAERQNAEAARELAEAAAADAESERQNAEAARELAEIAAADAEVQRRFALRAQADAEAAAAEAEAAAAEADAQRLRADQERERALLELAANNVLSLQSAGEWEKASNLLGRLWRDFMRESPMFDEEWLVGPLETAFVRQSLANYPTRPDFLDFSSLDGWSGRTGRFRVYGLDQMLPDGSTVEGDKRIAVFDVMTGTVTGSFILPPGVDLGSEPDRVSPDGTRVAIITDDGRIAMWAAGWSQPMLMPVPQAGEYPDDLEQIAPVSTGDRLVLYLERDFSPSEILVVEPNAGDPAFVDFPFSIGADSLADILGESDIFGVDLLGLVDDHLYTQVSGVVLRIDVATGEILKVPTDPDVTAAAITPDGQVLLTLACPGACDEQRLRAYDLNRNAMGVWFDRAPKDMRLTANVFSEITAEDGATRYSVAAEDNGIGVVFSFPAGRPDAMQVFDGRSTASIGAVSFDGDGGFMRVEDAPEDAGGDLVPAGQVGRYRVPLSREALDLYVAPNSVAIHGGNTARVAGVDYNGQLLVYNLEADGRLEEDYAFPQTLIAESDCVSAVAFGGDGQSILFRHADGSLRYVTASGAGVDWHQPLSPTDGTLIPSAPVTASDDCPEADEEDGLIVPQIVATGPDGDEFMLLDEAGDVWALRVAGGPEEGQDDTALGAGAMERLFEPMIRLDTVDGLWIASDPAMRRVAIATERSVTVLGPGGASANDGAGAAEADGARGEPGSEARADEPDDSDGTMAAGQGSELQETGRQVLPRRGEPRLVEFVPDGRIVVVYADGELALFRREADAWVLDLAVEITQSLPMEVFATADQIAIVDDRDLMVAYDTATGAPLGSARIPADPSRLALLENGSILSVEWDTDGASALDFRAVARHDLDAIARLVTMRSLLDQEEDDSVDALTRGLEADAQAAEDGGPATAQCAEEAKRRLVLLEQRILGDSATPELECAHADTPGSVLSLGEQLVARSSDIGDVLDHEAFSRLLAGAAAGDPAATRLIGALLESNALRGAGDMRAIAADAARFGASLPIALLKEIGAGAPIDDTLLALIRDRQAIDPSAHHLLAHALERRINDVGALSEALFQFAAAERLYGELGRAESLRFVGQQRFAGHRRAQLARLLPDSVVLDVYARLDAWSPEPMGFDADAVLPEAADDIATRRESDLESLALLQERLPDSPLLALLGAELQRGRIRDLAADDPKQAVDLLLSLEGSGTDGGWSPGVADGYLEFARELDDEESVFRLAAAAMRLVGLSFFEPIHEDADVVQLFSEAAALATSTAAAASDDVVAAATAELDLPFIGYEYATLPAVDAHKGIIEAAMQTLASAADFAAIMDARAGGASRWGAFRGQALFWQGVLVNDDPDAKEEALRIFRTGAESLQPVVEADPDNPPVRFLYAETLRWVGLTGPSTREIADVIAASVDQYAQVWDDRWMLEDSLVDSVGAGYGFALANLARRIRAVELGDGTDLGSAEDHAGWVLEVLALAAEKDAVNAAMIEMGMAEDASSFMTGWYRMVSYGLQIGFLSGMVNVETSADPATDCDLVGADINDPRRRAPGFFIDRVDAERAEALCRAQFERNPDDLRALHQLARALYAPVWHEGGATTDSDEFVRLSRAAAEQGVSASFSLLADVIDSVDTTRGDRAYHAASQRIIIDAFPVLYPFLERIASTPRQREGLAWYAGAAAALGVPEASMVLGELLDDPAEKRFYFGLAARLWAEAGDADAASVAEERARATSVGAAEADEVANRVAEWTGEPLVALPDSVDDSN